MLKRRNLVTLIAGTFLVASSAMAQFADRNIKFTNGVNEDHPWAWVSRKCKKCWQPRPAAR